MIYTEKRRTKFLALPLTFTTYMITDEKITITSGFLDITIDDAYMYKVQDVKLTMTFFERIFKLGTVTCYTGDTTHPELRLLHIRKAHEIKDFIMSASEEARRKRRTLHTMDIDINDYEVID